LKRYETISLDIDLPPFDNNIPSGMSLLLYDHDPDGTIDLIGRTW